MGNFFQMILPKLTSTSKNPSHHWVIVNESTDACTLLSRTANLPKARIKDAMNKGAVWLKRPGHKERRIRRATLSLRPLDRIDLYYDPVVLALHPPPSRLIAEEKQYGVWFKPANMLTQGTRYGDHCSLLRWIEVYYGQKKDILPVHRLDREAFGLVLVAYSRKAANALSELFRQGKIEKRYRAKVYGNFSNPEGKITFSQSLDGKEAVTIVEVVSSNRENETTTLDIVLRTGRFHQIRRHLSQAGHPVIGDPKYGITGHTTGSTLQLCAYNLKFNCPLTGQQRCFKLEESIQPT